MSVWIAITASAKVTPPNSTALGDETVIAFALIAAASAQFISGRTLYDDCASPDAVRQAHCMAFIVGVADTISFVENSSAASFMCIPYQIKATQVRDVTFHYLADHPSLLDRSASSLVAKALSDMWPCP